MVWARQYPRTKSHPHIVFPIPREIDSGAIPDHVTGAGSFEHVKDDFYASAIQVLPQQYDRDGPSQGLLYRGTVIRQRAALVMLPF